MWKGKMKRKEWKEKGKKRMTTPRCATQHVETSRTGNTIFLNAQQPISSFMLLPSLLHFQPASQANLVYDFLTGESVVFEHFEGEPEHGFIADRKQAFGGFATTQFVHARPFAAGQNHRLKLHFALNGAYEAECGVEALCGVRGGMWGTSTAWRYEALNGARAPTSCMWLTSTTLRTRHYVAHEHCVAL